MDVGTARRLPLSSPLLRPKLVSPCRSLCFRRRARRATAVVSCCCSLFRRVLKPGDDVVAVVVGCESSPSTGRVLLKGMSYPELEAFPCKRVQCQGFRPDQALMLWKRLYGNNTWAHSSEEVEGLNKYFKQMLSDEAEFKALNLKDIRTAADGTREEQGLHFSRRKVTVSTSGLVPQLKRFLHESSCTLAVSLNETTDEAWNWIIPINRKYDIAVLLQTLWEELKFKKNYKVLFEYVMLSGVNDSLEDAKRLVDLCPGNTLQDKSHQIQFSLQISIQTNL